MIPTLKLLLVDDDPGDRALFGEAVQKTGLDIWFQTVSGGEELIEYLDGRGAYAERNLHPLPDLLVLDLRMPGMSGLDILGWRNAAPAFSSLPVIIFSAVEDKEQTQTALHMGADAVIRKTMDFPGWIDAVRHVWAFWIALLRT